MQFMGLMDKFKNLFTEEIEEEVRPIKKEVRHVEIPSPKRSEIVKPEVNNISDSSVITKEEKVIAPVYFDDKDFDDLEKPKEKPKNKEIPKREDKPKIYGGNKVKIEEKKTHTVTFKPSPIISPVYGILDKNYFKDDVSPKISSGRSVTNSRRNSDKVTIDDIRNKAYGTLEDELKDSFFNDDFDISDNNKDDSAIDVLEDLNFDEIDDTDDEIKLTDHKVNSIILEDLDLDDDTELLAKQLEEQNKKLEEINQMIDEEEKVKVLKEEKKDTENNNEHVETKKEEKDDSNKIEEVKKESVNEVSNKDNMEVKKDEPKKRSDKKNKQPESLTDSELFDLVDSMYDEKGE